MEQNPIDNVLITFDMAKDVLKNHITDENQIESLYKLVNQSEIAFRLAVGIIQKNKINLEEFIEKLTLQLNQSLSTSEHDDKNKEIIIIIALILLNATLQIVSGNNYSPLRKDIISLLAYIEMDSIPLSLIAEAVKSDENSIHQALEPAIQDLRICWDKAAQSYVIDPKLKHAYLMINIQLEKQFPRCLLNLIEIYSAKFSKVVSDAGQLEIDNIIREVRFTITRIQAAAFRIEEDFLLSYISLIENIGSYELQVNKNGERALEYFEQAQRSLKFFQYEPSDTINQCHIRIFAKSITANVIVAKSYLPHNPNLAIEQYQKLAPIVEKFYKDEPLEIAKFLFNRAIAYGVIGQLQKRREICEHIFTITKFLLNKNNPKNMIFEYHFAQIFYKLDEFEKSAQFASHALDVIEKNGKEEFADLTPSVLEDLQEILINSKRRIDDSKLSISSQKQKFFPEDSKSSSRKQKATNKEKDPLLIPVFSEQTPSCCCIS